MRYVFLALLLVSSPARAQAEWQLKPFIGLTFGGGTNLYEDVEHQVGKPKTVIGVTTALLGEIFGVEADIGHTSGFLDDPDQSLIIKSGLTTITGNAMVAMPRRISEYSLRPYFVAGAGMIRSTATSSPPGVFELNRTFPALDIGGGVTGFLGPRLGLSWDVRHFRNLNRKAEVDEQLSFWRANMALAIRY